MYVTLKSPKGWQKTRFCCFFPVKFNLCQKKSATKFLCKNFERQSCSYTIPLSNGPARYWSKIADLNLPQLYLAPPLWRRNFRIFWRQITRIPGLSYGVVCVILHLTALIQYRRVTDGHTDRRTDGHMTTAYHASRASRSKSE